MARGSNRKVEWIFLTPNEYQRRKENLPDIVYASRCPIEWIKASLD